MHSGSPEVAALEAEYIREVFGPMTFQQALAVFTDLWMQALRLNPDFPGPWEEDVAPDIELARVLNALPRTS
jgi:hypothetical protein